MSNPITAALSNVSWGKKILGLSAVLISGSVVVGAVGAYALYYETQFMQSTIKASQARLDAANNARVAIVTMSRSINGLIASQEPGDIRRAAIATIRASSGLDENIHNLADTLKDSANVAELKRLVEQNRTAQVKILKAGKSKKSKYDHARKRNA